MRRFPLILILAALPVAAQEATLNSSVSRSSITKIKIDTFYCDRTPQCKIATIKQDSSNVDIEQGAQVFFIPSAAGQPCTSATTVSGLAGAMNVTRATETGANARIQSFRILGYLSDQGCLSGVTLVP